MRTQGKPRLIQTTLVGGILFLVPIVVLFTIVEKGVVLAHRIVQPLATHLPIHSILGLETPKILAILLLILFCFLAGLGARTTVARRFISWLETTFLSNLPGYEFMKGIGENLLGVQNKETYDVVLARIEDCWQLAFL